MKLDIGSGEGRYKDYTTVDNYCPEADVKADIGNLPFSDNSVDAIWASHILEHVVPPTRVQAVLKEWLRVLKPGAVATIIVPDLDYACRSWLQRDPYAQSKIFGSCDREGQFHTIGWGPVELRDEVAAAGFHVLTSQAVHETAECHLGGSYIHHMVQVYLEAKKP